MAVLGEREREREPWKTMGILLLECMVLEISQNLPRPPGLWRLGCSTHPPSPLLADRKLTRIRRIPGAPARGGAQSSRGYMGIMEQQMETTIMGYIGIIGFILGL